MDADRQKDLRELNAIRERLEAAENAGDAAYIGSMMADDVVIMVSEHQPSCHDDTSDALLRAAEKCDEWIAYSPAFQQYRYVALVTKRRVFALAIGQRSVYYRLPKTLHAVALQTGATEAADIGPDWVCFDLFRSDWPTPDLPFWTLNAYAAAREAAP
ncbi:MAG: hypothetical protein A3G76_08630 [Acidobacteria bacterium RIFCSPLOWO2_12_FULL_65_11]|nr:MAG: hypothetical protein A3H95_09370 [Acidobacteria bacterium RIFCSPLOWO2_02_FULL_64_15]OFW33565.1 MAG: hypothetical protein A3G76_08630 [Acidobacteria bacterium RIFCSPLOWO2_12_FULL_65_11]